MGHRLRLGVSPFQFFRPLTAPLASQEEVTLTVDVPARLALSLRAGDLDAALLSPIDYAREASLYRIVPGAAIASTAANNTAMLFVRNDIQEIASLAADPSFSADIVLARLILSEQFESEPAIIPVPQSPVAEMLRRADAALLTADTALREQAAGLTAIDLVEEWNELTGMPYVHAIWCGRQGALDAPRREMLRNHAAGASTLVDAEPDPALREYLQGFSYELSDDIADAIREFFHYSYFHGVLPDVPELNFYSDEEDAEARNIQ